MIGMASQRTSPGPAQGRQPSFTAVATSRPRASSARPCASSISHSAMGTAVPAIVDGMVRLDLYAETWITLFLTVVAAPGAQQLLISFDVARVDAEGAQLGQDVHGRLPENSSVATSAHGRTPGFPGLPPAIGRRRRHCRRSPKMQ